VAVAVAVSAYPYANAGTCTWAIHLYPTQSRTVAEGIMIGHVIAAFPVVINPVMLFVRCSSIYRQTQLKYRVRASVAQFIRRPKARRLHSSGESSFARR
jgi:hypothetical protein